MSDLRAVLSSAVCVLASALSAGCGGSTGNADMSSAGDSGPEAAAEAGASSAFNPGAIGSLVGSAPLADAGSSSTPDDAGGLTVTPQVVDGCSALCTKEA